MKLNSIHRGKTHAPPDLGSLQHQNTDEIFRVLREASGCAGYMLAFLHDLESLIQDARKEGIVDSNALDIE